MTSKSLFKKSVVALFCLSVGVAIAAGMRQRNQGSGTYTPPPTVSAGAFTASCPNGLCTFSGTVPAGTTQVVITGSGPGSVSFTVPVAPPSTSFNFSAPTALPINGDWSFSFSAQNAVAGTSVQASLPATTPAYALPGTPAVPSSISCSVAACTVTGTVPTGADSITVRGASSPSGATSSINAVISGSSYTASFTNLSGGAWTFMVDATNRGGTTTSPQPSASRQVLAAAPNAPSQPTASCVLGVCTVTGSVPAGATSVVVKGVGPSGANTSNVNATVNGGSYSATVTITSAGTWNFKAVASNSDGVASADSISSADTTIVLSPCNGSDKFCGISYTLTPAASGNQVTSGYAQLNVTFKANPVDVQTACLAWTSGGRPIGTAVTVNSSNSGSLSITGTVGDGSAVAEGGVKLVSNSACANYPSSGSSTTLANAWTNGFSVVSVGAASNTVTLSDSRSCDVNKRTYTVSATALSGAPSPTLSPGSTWPTGCALSGSVLTITGPVSCSVTATSGSASSSKTYAHALTASTVNGWTAGSKYNGGYGIGYGMPSCGAGSTLGTVAQAYSFICPSGQCGATTYGGSDGTQLIPPDTSVRANGWAITNGNISYACSTTTTNYTCSP